MRFDNSVFLQAAGGGDSMMSMLFMAAMFAVVYFFMIRPQAKKQKEQQQFSDSVKVGAEIVTASGILGQITKIEGDIITLLVDHKTHIRVTRNAISKEMTEAVAKSK